ncbi:unnamed protein product [Mycena citricolor]|uniref:Uncharacterized protein n=1 Tax=Mycena citricolor TaxID=2018698 RepID=A0AAD2HAF1_9AGAR|nr:unnamed protein product [Mycena citricolor]
MTPVLSAFPASTLSSRRDRNSGHFRSAAARAAEGEKTDG